METSQQLQLLDCVHQTIRSRHLSRKTEKSYLYYIQDFILFYNQNHPKELGASEIQNYLSHLAVEKSAAASTQNVALSALLFLYRKVLSLDLPDLEKIERPDRPQRLPAILSRPEVQAILEQVKNGEEGLVVRLLYGTGMRLSECLRLRVRNIDFKQRKIVVYNSKGKKDRVTILPRVLASPLQKQLARAKLAHQRELLDGYGEVEFPPVLARRYPNAQREWGWQYVFPAHQRSRNPKTGQVRRHHLSEDCIQRTLKQAKQAAGITKGSCHTLRHSFAVHLLEEGYSVHTVKELLGHKDVKTTMLYTQLLEHGERGVRSPLDRHMDVEGVPL